MSDTVKKNEDGAPASSNYAMRSHSARVIGEDIYVSDGSESDEDDMAVIHAEESDLLADKAPFEIVLTGSMMGLMKRGIHRSALVQPNRQWSRQIKVEAPASGEASGEANEDGKEEAKDEIPDDETPAQRAARLLAEKQRKLEEAKVNARRTESEENAGRDACLFSKRTAFDIRFDQIEDKPWVRGAGELTDFFNYSLSEEDWLEYSEQQLAIRQELTDASRQKRPADPNIVPVTPRAPRKQAPRVAVTSTSDDDSKKDDAEGSTATADEPSDDAAMSGPVLAPNPPPNQIRMKSEHNQAGSAAQSDAGGAWGAGIVPGSKLAQLLQQQSPGGGWNRNPPPPPQPQQQQQQHNSHEYYPPPPSHSQHHQQHNQQHQYQQNQHQQQQHQSQYSNDRHGGGRHYPSSRGGFQGGRGYGGGGPPHSHGGPPPPPPHRGSQQGGRGYGRGGGGGRKRSRW